MAVIAESAESGIVVLAALGPAYLSVRIKEPLPPG
jgi:hypothetical protein